MPLHTRLVGQTTDAISQEVDARWIMAYAAGIDDLNPCYMDTQAGRVTAHPVFPVCLEWPVVLASRALAGSDSMTPEEGARGVHAAHDLHIYRPIRAGEVLSTRATVLSLQAIRPGAAQVLRLDTVDEDGRLVCRTYQLGISRGVAIEGAPVAAVEEAPPLPERLQNNRAAAHSISAPAGAAHVYTECARIFNPIHTDRAVALAAGLPDIILHGTATMALAVSLLVNEYLDGDPTRVRRLGGRFTAMVLMPADLSLIVSGVSDEAVFFSVQTEGGGRVFDNAFLCYR